GGCQGLGREICRQMIAKNWRVTIADINGEAGPAIVRELQEQGGEAFFVAIDLGSPEGPSEMIERTVERFGRLDVLVNCAAYAPVESFLARTPATWECTLNVNVRGIALAISAAGQQMKQQKGGRMINIASPASRMALPNYAAY